MPQPPDLPDDLIPVNQPAPEPQTQPPADLPQDLVPVNQSQDTVPVLQQPEPVSEDMIRTSPAKNIIDSMREAAGEEPLGMSQKTFNWFVDKGIFRSESGIDSPAKFFQAFAENTIYPAAAMLDAAGRLPGVLFRGAQATGIEMGAPKDVVSIPDAFLGSPHPTGIPHVDSAIAHPQLRKTIAKSEIAAESRAQRSGAEPPPPEPVRPIVEEIPKAAERADPQATMKQARDLGVVGPEQPRITEGSPADAAKAAIPPSEPPGVGGRGPGEPAPVDPWRQRFDEFVGKLKTEDDVKQLISESADQNGDFIPARQGDIPLSHVEKIEQAAGVEPGSTDRRGLGRLLKNDNEVRNAMQLMLQVTENVRDAARAVRGDGSPENLIKMQEAILRRDLAVEQIVGLRAEWGRTGRVFQEFLQQVKDAEGLSEFLRKKGRTPEDLRDIADAVTNLNGTDAAKVLNSARGKQMSPVFYTWVNGLISGLLTHTKYVFANAVYRGVEDGVVTPIAAMIGKAKQVAGVEAERVFFGEAPASVYGLISSVPAAVIGTARSMKAGMRLPLESEIKVRQALIARGEPVPASIERLVNPVTGMARPIEGVWGRIIGAPGDAAGGIHTFFKIMGERAGIEAEAYRKTIQEGLSPSDGAFIDRYRHWAANPAEDMMTRAIEGAYKGTFMQELGPRGKAWQRFTKETPGLKWLFPFSHIPVNLMKATIESTPLGYLDSAVRDDIVGKNGGVRQDKAIARMVVGSSIMGWFVHKYMTGQATGDLPRDQNERDAWTLSGKQPNSIRIGDYWVSFKRFGPAGSLASLGANLGGAIERYQKGDDEALTAATWKMAEAASKIAMEEVGFLSLEMLFEAFHNPDTKGASWVASQASSFIPFSSLVSQTASGGLPFTGGALGDPYMREAKTIVDGIKYRIPGLRETLLPKRDWLGEPVLNPQYGNILRTTKVNEDPAAAEMARLEIHPGHPSDRIGGVKLTKPIYDEYQVQAGALTKFSLDSLVKMPGWSALPDAQRETAIKGMIKSARQSAAAAMQLKYPQLISAGIKQRQDWILGNSRTTRPKAPPPELQNMSAQ